MYIFVSLINRLLKDQSDHNASKEPLIKSTIGKDSWVLLMDAQLIISKKNAKSVFGFIERGAIENGTITELHNNNYYNNNDDDYDNLFLTHYISKISTLLQKL